MDEQLSVQLIGFLVPCLQKCTWDFSTTKFQHRHPAAGSLVCSISMETLCQNHPQKLSHVGKNINILFVNSLLLLQSSGKYICKTSKQVKFRLQLVVIRFHASLPMQLTKQNQIICKCSSMFIICHIRYFNDLINSFLNLLMLSWLNELYS